MLMKVGTKQNAQRIFLAEDARKIKVEANLTDRWFFAVLRCIRATYGKSFIQKGIKPALSDRKNVFESLFEFKKIAMESSGGAITLHFVVFCLYVGLFINRIAALR